MSVSINVIRMIFTGDTSNVGTLFSTVAAVTNVTNVTSHNEIPAYNINELFQVAITATTLADCYTTIGDIITAAYGVGFNFVSYQF